ncbi:putative Ig domain-containing protein [Calothrix sp. UHCC 0171]|uniref:putative Ig domain-containing protein n=1 Tax=Calothrix sp. UHCC 0171 TaxID=3110245 RepID=UPI002B2205AE|nr:putative Ig domain-containing protein [Calothrix sp. UHCC 0171]MEA5574578.1 putative Ig domain-containing protein [Calothrix sp. UHCC 0171]
MTSTPLTTASTSQNYIYDVNALDANGDSLTYSLLSAPTGMAIDQITGEIVWGTSTQKLGNYAISILVNDGRGATDVQNFVIELTDIPWGEIRGTIWDDINSNSLRDIEVVQGKERFLEPGMSGIKVYLDINNNGILDTNEPIQITANDNPNTIDVDETGNYKFTRLEEGTYIVRQVVPANFIQTFPRGLAVGEGGVSITNGSLNLIQPKQDIAATFVGRAGVSTDGLGTFSTGSIQAQIPAGSKVEYAFLHVATRTFDQPFRPTTIGFEGISVAISWLDNVGDTGLNFETGRVDITSIVANKVDSRGGIYNFTVDELITGNARLVEGVSLTVIYSNPSLPQRTIAILDGGLTGANPQTNILSLGSPIDKTDPNFIAQMALGIQYSAGGQQFSTVDVNGRRLTTSAAGSDDGIFFSNGSLVTVGGVGDSFANPILPLSNATGDDELYNLSPFLNNGDTFIRLDTANPSNDDSIFLIALTLPGAANIAQLNGAHLVELKRGEIANNRNFGNAKINENTLNQAPDIISEAPVYAQTNKLFRYDPVAVDPDGGTLAFELVTKPDGMAIDSNTGTIVWKPDLNQQGIFDVSLRVRDSFGASDLQNFRIVVGKDASTPVITSNAPSSLDLGNSFIYQIQAFDPNKDSLAYRLNIAPTGMTIDENGLINWVPGTAGAFPVEIQVDDGNGGIASQRFELVVTSPFLDTEAPQVNLGFNSSVLKVGETLNLKIQGFDNVGLADLDLSFNGNSLALTPDDITNGFINTASLTLNQTGVFELVAKATDFAGNTDIERISVRVINPNDKKAPIVELDASGFDPSNLVINKRTDIIGSVNDADLEFYRVELAPISLIDISNPAAIDPDYITIAEGRGNVNNGILAQIDPNLYRNDTYYVRVYSQDFSGNINVQGLVLGLNSQNKPGEFSLDFTDLSIPLTGIPIEITRSYSSLDANFQGDFGYGWELGMQDAGIVESSPTGTDLKLDNFFGGNSFTVGTRVTLNTPDGRRVGFTFDPQVDGGGFLGARYKPYFRPDPGVYETLEVPYFPLSLNSDGSTGLYLFGFTYNPSDYTLITKDGTKYNYNQYQGLKTVNDRNGNILTFADDGITSSTGVEIDFIRDAKGRITQIIDPDGKSLKYSYDANGNLIEFSDRTSNETTFKYEGDRPHYLTEIIDPLGRTGVRTEYDEKGQISKIFDADGNALDINYNSAASRQTVKDPFGNTTTYVFDERGNVASEVDALGGVTARTYDRNNNVISETDPEGNITSYTYDSRGNKLTETNGEGNTTRFTYNANNDLLTETDPLGNTTTYNYDAKGNLTSRRDAAGKVTTYNYNQFGLLTEVIDANSNRSNFTYDVFGNITALTDPTGVKTSFTYDRNGRVTSVTDALGAITNYIYDAQGRLIEKADPEGSSCGCARGITKTEYNAAGEKIAEIDALGRRTEYRYNERGLLIETILPDETPTNLADNPRTKNEYDALDRLIATVDELGRKTLYIYDKLGRQIEVIYPDSTPNDLTNNPRTKKVYDKAGLVIAEIDELGNRTEFDYDKADRLTVRTNALGEVTTYIYDADGRQIAMTDGLGRITNYAYDGLDRLISTTYANNTVMAMTYDSLGRIVAETDLAGNTTKYEYDALGRLTAVVDVLNQRTEYKYDAVGNLIEQKDANGNITKFEYDSLRQRKAMILPGGQRNETIHDKIGNLIRVTDFNGATTTYEYNARNWLTEKSFSDGTSTENFTYTLTGELASVTDNRGVTNYSYDERDRLLSRTEPDNRQITYTYDAAGNILSLTVPSGATKYTYDALNRIDTVIDPDGGITDYSYDAVSNLIKTQFANGVTENQQYDLLNRLTYLENRNQTGIISSYSYTLDAMGNRTKVVENDGRVVDYSYDKLYRLIQEKITDAVARNKTSQYKFDSVGNRLERIDSVEGTTTYSYDKNDRLIEEALGGKVTQYQYDNNGNLTAQIENGQTQAQYKWNTKGELIAVETTENGETGRVEFEYDHEGIRVAIKVDGEETRFLIDSNQQQYAQVIEEYKANGTVEASYVHGWDLISQEDANGRIFYQVDGLGTTRQLTNNNGLVIQEYDYDAYGNLTQKVGNASNNYLFAGEQFDDAVDGYYLRARYYDPATGRFVSRDSFEGFNNQPLTLHDYYYAKNNPTIFVDPSGNIAILENAFIQGGLVGTLSASVAEIDRTGSFDPRNFNGLAILGGTIAGAFSGFGASLFTANTTVQRILINGVAGGSGNLLEQLVLTGFAPEKVIWFNVAFSATFLGLTSKLPGNTLFEDLAAAGLLFGGFKALDTNGNREKLYRRAREGAELIRRYLLNLI